MLDTLQTYLPDVFGLIGVFLLVIGYFLLNTEKIKVFSLTYQLLNLLGSAGILISLLFKFNLSAFVIEVIWVLISLIGIRKVLKDNKKGYVKNSV